jgi:hypothetical protein
MFTIEMVSKDLQNDMLQNDAQTPTHFMYPRLQRANGANHF